LKIKINVGNNSLQKSKLVAQFMDLTFFHSGVFSSFSFYLAKASFLQDMLLGTFLSCKS
jgi:hypothetical protein